MQARMAELDVRPFGFTVFPPPNVAFGPAQRKSGLELGERGAHKWLRIERTGCVLFEGCGPFLAWDRMRRPETPIVNTYPLVEGPSSFAKLLKVLGDTRDLTGSITLTLELWGARGWKFRPYRPTAIGWPDAAILGTERDLDEVPLICHHRTDWRRVRFDPEAEAFRLVAELWEETLGIEQELIPFWDARRGRFHFD